MWHRRDRKGLQAPSGTYGGAEGAGWERLGGRMKAAQNELCSLTPGDWLGSIYQSHQQISRTRPTPKDKGKKHPREASEGMEGSAWTRSSPILWWSVI